MGTSGTHIKMILTVQDHPHAYGDKYTLDLNDYCTRDHPHAYGDKSSFAYIFPHSIGSSPRVWGQVTKKMVEDLKARIIPTRMGTSDIVI